MKHWRKTVLAVLLTAAMLCGMLTPAAAWFVHGGILRTPNGEFWVNCWEVEHDNWMYGTDGYATVWSQDGVVWYTAEGLAQYLQIAVMPDENWMSRTVTYSDVSPDWGMMWLDRSAMYTWQTWEDYWMHSAYQPEPVCLYRSNGSFILYTSPRSSDYTTVMVSDLYAYQQPVCSIESGFLAYADQMSGVYLSAVDPMSQTQPTWKKQIVDADWLQSDTQYGCPAPSSPFYEYHSPDPFNPGAVSVSLLPGASFNPRTRTVTAVSYDGNQFTLSNAGYWGINLLRRELLLRATRRCTVAVELSCSSSMPFVYQMLNLEHLMQYHPGCSVLSIEATSGGYNGSINDPFPFLLLGSPAYHQAYYPLILNNNEATVIDANRNGIIDPEEATPSVQLDTNPLSVSPSVRLVLQIEPGAVVPLEFYSWIEGQDPTAVGQVMNDFSTLDCRVFLDDFGGTYGTDNDSMEYPIVYREQGNGVTITGIVGEFFTPLNTGMSVSDMIEGFSYDPATAALTLPHTINGMPVVGLDDFALIDVTDPQFCPYGGDIYGGASNNSYDTQPPVRQVILPNTMCTVGDNVTGPSLERVHVPFGASVEPYSFPTFSQNITICCDMPNSNAQQTHERYGTAGMYNFVVCTEHGTSHTHTFGEWTVETEPTCTASGTAVRTCTLCGMQETEPIPPAHDYDSGTVLYEPTCTAPGRIRYECTACGRTYSEPIPALEHEWSEYSSDPTCTAKGYEGYRCSRCEVLDVQTEYPAFGHDYDAEVVDATCTQDGYTRFTCRRCGDSYDIGGVPAFGHDWQYVHIYPTCTESGYEGYRCSHCEVLDIETEYPAPGHDYVLVASAEATCTEDGYRRYLCTRCGDVYDDDFVPAFAPELGHDFGEWIVTTEPTAQIYGEETRACLRCGVTETRLFGCCDDYGEDMMWFFDESTGTLTITGTGDMEYYDPAPWEYLKQDIKAVVICDGVTSIGDSAFLDCTALESVELPESLEYIDVDAFKNCTSLTSVTIPKNVTDIDAQAFDGCTALTSVVWNAAQCSANGTAVFRTCTALQSITFGDSVRTIPANTFTNLTSVKSITIGKGVTSIGNAAFRNCTNLESVTWNAECCTASGSTMTTGAFYMCNALQSVTFGENVRAIPAFAFANCRSVTSVTIPKNVTSIGNGAFRSCVSLSRVIWNAEYCTTAGGNVTNGAFYLCNTLEDITFGEGVRTIPAYALSQCHRLAHVTIPNGLSSVGSGAFTGCGALETVCYGGINAADISIASGNIPLQNAVWYYHTHNEDLETMVCDPVAPTCSDEGYTGDVCYAPCGVFKHAGEAIPVDPTAHRYAYVITATCTKAGSRNYICSLCGDVASSEPYAALGHNYDAVVIDPTCTETGCTRYTCSRCGDSYDENETPALGHDCDMTVYDPTCTEDGYTLYTCARCGESYIEDEIPAFGHDWGEWTVTLEPTLTTNGEETRRCALCDETDTRPIDKLVGNTCFSIDTVDARPGQTIEVRLSIADNPGIVATKIGLDYDPQILTLTAVDNGSVFPDAAFQPGGDLSAAPFGVIWLDALTHEDYAADGTLATFTFTVSPDAPDGVTPVTLTYEQESTFDHDSEPVAFSVENGGVHVYVRMAGDASGDAEVNLKDVTNLMRFLVGGWDVTVDASSADVDGDGKLTLRDVTILRRYLAGWKDYETYFQTA